MEKNKLTMQDFKHILGMTQEELHFYLLGQIASVYRTKDIYRCDGEFIYVRGEAPVMLCAHLDTVHAKAPTEGNIFHDKEKNVMWSPVGIGGDDRCGVFNILDILRKGYRPHLLFSWNEEIGCVGSRTFTNNAENYFGTSIQDALSDVNFAIQFDRKGFSEAVYYDLDNQDFEEYINSFGFQTDLGSFTDIAVVCPGFGFAGVNVSAGYMDEHNKHERIYVDELYATQSKVINILEDQLENSQFFKYEEVVFAGGHGYGWGYGGNDIYQLDDDDDWLNSDPYYQGLGVKSNTYYFDQEEEVGHCEFCSRAFGGKVKHSYDPDVILNSLCDDCREDYVTGIAETKKNQNLDIKDDVVNDSQKPKVRSRRKNIGSKKRV